MRRLPTARTEIHLACSHVRFWREDIPKIGEKVFCDRCENMRVVIGKTGTWEARCRRCNFLQRRAGYEPIVTVIRRHLRFCPRHVIQLSQIGNAKTWTVKLDKPDTHDATTKPILAEIESAQVLF